MEFLITVLAVLASVGTLNAANTPELPSLEKLLSMGNRNVLEMYVVTSNCNVRVNKSGPCEMALVTDHGDCVKPGVLIRKLLGAKFETSKIRSSIPTAVSLKSAKVDKCDKTLNVGIAVQGDYETAKGLGKLSDVSLFMINIGVQPFKFNFRISGTWSLGDIKFGVTMLKSDTPGQPIVYNTAADTEISIGKFIDLLIGNFGTLALPPKFDLDRFLGLRLVSFAYNSETKMITVPVEWSTSIEFTKAIKLQKVKIIFKVHKRSATIGFDIQSKWKLGPLTIPLNISKPKGLPVFLAESRPKFEISFGIMIKQFLVGILPSGPLKNAVKKVGFDGFSVKNPYFQIYFATDVVVRLSGTAVIGAWDKCQVEIMIGNIQGAAVMATGIVLENVPITTLIYQVTKFDLRKIPGAAILDNTDVAISMASQNVPKLQDFMQFSIPALKDVEILDGVFLVTSFKFPEDCKDDIGCQVFKSLIGSSLQIVLKGRLFISEFYISASIPTEIQLFESVNITDVGFELQAGLTRKSISLTGSLKLSSPPLTFKGSFGISTSGVFLEMSMAGLWNKPFGIPILAIGDLHFRIAIVPTPTVISVLEMGGRAMIGDIGNKNAKPINVFTYIGIDLVSPSESYFYGSVSALTLPSIVKAFGHSLNLPKPLADTGFPKGLNLSYSLKTKVLPNGVTIVGGYFFQGIIKVLFLEVHSDVKLNLNGIWINVSVSPFSIANDLIAIKGRSDTSGPRIVVDVGWNPPRAFINIEGSIKVLGIQCNTNLTISNKGASFYVSGSFLNLVEAELNITTQNFDLKSADFHVSGWFRQSLLQKLHSQVTDVINNYKEAADKAIRKVQDRINDAKKAFDKAADKIVSFKSKLDSQKAICDSAIKTLESKKKFFEDKKKIFDSAVKKLKDAQNSLSRKKKAFDDAVKKRADKLKKGCPGGCRKKRAAEETFLKASNAKQFLSKSRRVKRWIRIRWKNPFEIAREAGEIVREKLERGREIVKERARESKCAIKNIARKACLVVISGLAHVVKSAGKILDAAKVALKAAEFLVAASKKSMDVAKVALTVAQKAMTGCYVVLDAAKLALTGAEILVRNTEMTLNVAIGALDVVRTAHHFGVEIGKKLLSFALGGLIDIHEISFSVQLAAAETGHFRVSVTASILGQKKNFSLNINLRSIKDMVSELVTKVKNAIGLRRRRSVTENSLRTLGRVTRENRLEGDIYNCLVSRMVRSLGFLLVNDTEGLPLMIQQLKEITENVTMYQDVIKEEVTAQDIDDLVKMSTEDLLLGMDTVLEYYCIQIGLSHEKVVMMLKDVSMFSRDPCLKKVTSRLAKIYTDPERDIESTENNLILLEQELSCFTNHRCGEFKPMNNIYA